MPKKIYIPIIIVMMAVCIGAFAQDDLDKQFPYRAKVVGNDVYVRSGGGIQYYFTGKLNEPDEVVVVDRRYSWCKVVPPTGSFSWIAKEFIKLDPNQPGSGVVTADNVRVWAGASHLDPEDSTSPQGKLSTGDKVKLLGEESGDWYKIAPPKEAYLWIKGDYLKYVAPADVKFAAVEAKPAQETNEPTVNVEQPAAKEVEVKVEEPIVAVVTREPNLPKRTAYEIEKTKEVYGTIDMINEQRAKPLEEQDYAVAVEKLATVIADPNAGVAVKYAQHQLDKVEGYQLAIEVEKMMSEQDGTLSEKIEAIRKKHAAERAKIKEQSDYDIEGILKKSMVYDAKAGNLRYVVASDQGKILCYAVPAGGALGINLDEYIDKKVGLKGSFEPDAASGLSLLSFSEIKAVK